MLSGGEAKSTHSLLQQFDLDPLKLHENKFVPIQILLQEEQRGSKIRSRQKWRDFPGRVNGLTPGVISCQFNLIYGGAVTYFHQP